MLRYKKAYANHDFEILVDNARTHTAVKIDINKFNKGIGGKAMPEVTGAEWIDEKGNFKVLGLFFADGENKGKCKGLKIIAEELGFKDTNKSSLRLKICSKSIQNKSKATNVSHTKISNGAITESDQHEPTMPTIIEDIAGNLNERD
ncbi:hypothetical protein BpHYR1_023876 [Brachionus plicatilis]|uniref:Uncharacterized protein n=1 Tax=Brachionus plicatilis TaxID=10195 RepID=A0A3M7QN71_BRAPC|nr:hypothetical protein BpHYR1_023876 [Brachionus plicatilis]